MAKPSSSNLRVFREQPPKQQIIRPQVESLGSLPGVLRAFQDTTGRTLRYIAGPKPQPTDDLTWSAPVSPGVGGSPGHLILGSAGSEPTDSARSANSDSARAMASAISGMLSELMETRVALWKREAELAAGVPLIPHPDEEEHLAARLEAVLKGGAEAVGCEAAALYLLDEATTELKVRSCWGLPLDRLTHPARQLRGAVADLEALLGHVVVLNDEATMAYWKVPENFPAAVCVPVISPTTLLGTLWFFCSETKDFDDRQTNILEIVAGRVAADLEREMLLREGIDGAQLRHQTVLAEQRQRSQLPMVAPLLDGWDVAGWNCPAGTLGGEFYDWFCLPDGLLAFAVGSADEEGLAAAISSSALRASLRAHGQHYRQAEQAVKQVNLTLWTGSAGDQQAQLFYGLVETATGRVSYASAGEPGAVVIQSNAWKSLSEDCPPLGEGPESDCQESGYELRPGETIVLFTDGVRDAMNKRGKAFGESGVAAALVGKHDLSAEQMVQAVRESLDKHAHNDDGPDRTILVIRRTGA